MGLAQHLHAWLDAIARRKWTLWLLLGVIGLRILQALIDAFTGNIASLALDRFVKAPLLWFLSQPLGWGGLLVVGWFVLLLSLSWYETSPFTLRRREGKATRAPLSPDEKNEVERTREAWHGASEQACESAERLLESAIKRLWGRGNRLAPLLHWTIAELHDARGRVGLALHPDHPLPLAEVQARLATLIQTYQTAAAWINRWNRIDAAWMTDPSMSMVKYEYDAWLAQHTLFSASIRQLKKRASYRHFAEEPNEDAGRILLNDDRWGADGASLPHEEPVPKEKR